jgi:Rrf2 family protein
VESCRFAFAIHVMAVLALRRDQLCPSTLLAKTVNTNPVVIRRLLLDLQAAGLVKTERGPAGGAHLARSPVRIRIGDIYKAVEEPALFAAHRRQPSQACPVGCRIEPVLAELFQRGSKALEREFESITLDSVVRKIRRG